MRFLSPRLLPLAFALCAPVLAPALPAGDGTISNGKLNILVYFAYDEQDMASWQAVFTEFSKLLYDGTQKQLQLGKVTFTKCRLLKERADVWILNDNSGARAHLNGLGVRGRHITISQTHKSTTGNTRGQFGLCHEAGHYLWGILDEYKGYVGDTEQRDALHFCVTDGSNSCCIMDGGTTITPNNGRTEFCTTGFTNTKHNTGANNAAGVAVKNNQEYRLGKSCWARMVESGVGGLTEPTAEPGSDQAGHTDLTFETIDGQLAVAMVIDRSGSMGGTPMALAIQGAQLGVGLMSDGENLAVVSFSSSTSVDMSMRVIDAAARNAANAAIGGLVASGSTAIGAGLLAGQTQLDAVTGCAEIIVLLSDGFSNSGPTPASTIPTLTAAGTKVYSIALGSSVDVATLTQVAVATGGKFFAATTPAQLPAIFQRILVEVQGGVTVNEATQQSLASGSSADLVGEVPALTSQFVVSLGYGAGSPLTLSLRRPDGQIIDAGSVGTFPNATLITSNVQQVFTITNPQQGAWTATVSAGGSNQTFGYDLLMIARSDTLSLVADSGTAAAAFPEPIPVRVAVSAGWPVAGAQVTASVIDPNGQRLPNPVTLHDDGSAANGDQFPGDGVYSTRWFGYTSGSGSYTFEITVDNVNGTASTFTECPPVATGQEDGSLPIPIPPFRALVSSSGSVTGVPATIGTSTLDLSGNTALDGRTLSGKDVVRAVMLDVTLAANAGETLELDRLDIAAAVDSDPSKVGAFALHLDTDADGAVDSPSVPLAMATIQGGTLTFAPPGGLRTLSGTETARLLVTLGDERLASTADLLPPPLPPTPRPPLLPWLLAAATLATAGWLLLRRRPQYALPARTAGLTAVLIALLALGLTACRNKNRGAPLRIEGNLTLQLPTTGVIAVGATSSQPVTITGTAVTTSTKFE